MSSSECFELVASHKAEPVRWFVSSTSAYLQSSSLVHISRHDSSFPSHYDTMLPKLFRRAFCLLDTPYAQLFDSDDGVAMFALDSPDMPLSPLRLLLDAHGFALNACDGGPAHE